MDTVLESVGTSPRPTATSTRACAPREKQTGAARTWLFHAFERSIAIVLALAAWEVAPRLEWIDPVFFPPFSVVLRALVAIALSGELMAHTVVSLIRAIAGFWLGLVLAIPLGFVIGWFARARRAFDPILQALRQLPTFALFPLFVLLFGIGETAKIAIIAKASFWPVFVSTVSGVGQADPDLLRLARSMRVSSLGLFRKVVLPAATPSIYSGLRISGTIAFLMLIAAEMLGANAGIGYFVFHEESKFNIPKMYAGILVLTIYALILNYVLVSLERRANRWQPAAAV